MEIIEQILHKFEKEKSAYVQYELILELSKNQDKLLELIRFLFYHTDQSQSVIGRSIEFILRVLDETHLTLFTQNIIDNIEKEDNSWFLTEISTQFPSIIHTHFEIVFEKCLSTSTRFGTFFYNLKFNPSEEFIHFLKSTIEENSSKEVQKSAFWCLLLTKDIELIWYAIKIAREKIEFSNYEMCYGEDKEIAIENALNNVGFYLENNELKNFTVKNTYYIQFPKEYLGIGSSYYSNNYPLNDLEDLSQEYQFGGTITNTEEEQLNHIITLDSILEDINIFSLKKLILAVDFNFLWFKTLDGIGLFYQHDDNGIPIMISDKSLPEEAKENPFDNTPILKTTVRLALSPKRWEHFNDNFTVNQFGGTPKWVQSAELMICPKCAKKMQFLMQLGCNIKDEDDYTIMFGSGGSCYTFWCDTDKVSGYSWQCT